MLRFEGYAQKNGEAWKIEKNLDKSQWSWDMDERKKMFIAIDYHNFQNRKSKKPVISDNLSQGIIEDVNNERDHRSKSKLLGQKENP